MNQEIYLTGLLIPIDWFGNGQVKAVALATDDEKEVSIAGPLQNHFLLHLRQKVELWGTYEDPVHQTVFLVNRFQPKQTSHEKPGFPAGI